MVIRALKWSFFTDTSAKLMQPLAFIIFTKFIGPSDLGVFIAVLSIISFTQIFWEGGFSKAIIQFQDESESLINSAVFISLLAAVVSSIFLFFGSTFIADDIFNDFRLKDVIRIISLILPLIAFNNISMAILEMRMDFKTVGLLRSIVKVLPYVTAIFFINYGYWALIYSFVGSYVIQSLAVVSLKVYDFKIDFNSFELFKLFRFSRWIILTSIFNWVINWSYSPVISAFFGAETLGLFGLTKQIAMSVFFVLFNFTKPVIYSHLCSIDDDNLSSNISLDLSKLYGVLASTLGILIVLLGNIFFDFQNFIPNSMRVIFFLVVVKEMVSWVYGLFPEIVKSFGAPKIETIDSILSGLFHFSGILIAYFYSFTAYAYYTILGALLVSVFVKTNLLNSVFQSKYGSVLFKEFMKNSFFGLLILFSINRFFFNSAISIVYSIVVFFIFLRYNRSSFHGLYSYLKSI